MSVTGESKSLGAECSARDGKNADAGTEIVKFRWAGIVLQGVVIGSDFLLRLKLQQKSCQYGVASGGQVEHCVAELKAGDEVTERSEVPRKVGDLEFYDASRLSGSVGDQVALEAIGCRFWWAPSLVRCKIVECIPRYQIRGQFQPDEPSIEKVLQGGGELFNVPCSDVLEA